LDGHLNSVPLSRPKRLRLSAQRVAAAVGVTAVVVTAGGVALADEPEGRITGAGSAEVVAGSYVVVYKDGANPSATDLTARYGGRVSQVYQHSIRGFAVSGVTEQQAKRLAANKDIARVEHDAIVRVAPDTGRRAKPGAGAQAADADADADADQNDQSWGLDRIDQRRLPLDNKFIYGTASDVTVYVIDTGIYMSDPEFGGRAVSGIDIVDGDNDATDCRGNGTRIAGTIGGATLGVARQVKLVAVRVMNCAWSLETSDLIAAVDWVTANHAPRSVANISLPAWASDTVDEAVQRSIDAGVTYVVAANYSNTDACRFSPARVKSTIAVGISLRDDSRWVNDDGQRGSSYGGCLDLFAPGDDRFAPFGSVDDTGFVAGAAALVRSAHPDFSPQQVHDFLVRTATPDVVGGAGEGSPNKLLYIGNIGG
jgi:hypothetical protein